jgi:hypothetical protein
MYNTFKTAAATALVALLAAACSNSNDNNPVFHAGPTPSPAPTATMYTQIERLSRPAVKEAFEPFQDHQKSNAVEPYADSTIQADIVGTEDTLRPATSTTDYGAKLAQILYPDEYTVNLTGSAPSGADPYYFLSYEVDGPTYFGGRAPNDDVIDLELGALFGKTLSAIGAIADDGEENNCLSSQNIGGQGMFVEDSSKKTTSTFPYLPVAH